MGQHSQLDRRHFLALAGIGAVGTAFGAAAAPGASAAVVTAAPGGRPGAAARTGTGVRSTAVELPAGVPSTHGYDAPAIKSWSPDTDPYAKYLRARVPLAKRIPAFAPTQAHPGLDHRPRLMTLANDYMEPGNFALAHPYGTGMQAYALRFWQYVDMFGSWHGLPVYGQADAEEPRFGTINLPNPAWTDAAHRNGVLSLGCWYWPRPEDFAELVERRPDGTFPVAAKLVEMAAYFGFDGYFVNQEAKITPEQAGLLHQMLDQLNEIAPEGFHLQWYDALTMSGTVRYRNEFDEINSPWVEDDGERICDSIFLNYWWSQEKLRRSRAHAVELGLDPYEVVYAGTEAGLNNFSQPYDPRWIFPEREPALTSWAFLGTEFPWRLVPGDKETVASQRPVYTFERQWWSGPRQDPSRTGRSLPPTGEDNANPQRWDGVAHTIVEKSVVGSLPFVTHFNTGTGARFFVGGELVSDTGWFDIAVQDVLPTWQWWWRGPDGGDAATALTADYDYDHALDGGTSLAVTGALRAGSPAELRLYKTRLPVTHETALSLTFATADRGGASHLRAGLTFEDAPEEVTWLEAGRTGQDAWTARSWPLGRFAGRTLAAVSLGFATDADEPDYAVRIGELRLEHRDGDRDGPPRTPRGFTVEHTVLSGEGDEATATAYLRWEPELNEVAAYDVFVVDGAWDTGRTWVGRTYGEVYVLAGLRRTGDEPTTLELEPISPTGRRGRPARTRLIWS